MFTRNEWKATILGWCGAVPFGALYFYAGLLTAFITPVNAQIFTVDHIARQPLLAVFSTKSASVMVSGMVFIATTPEDAAKEASESIKVDCNNLAAKAHNDAYVYTMLFDVWLTALNNYHWSIGLKPNGDVVYENIKPTEEADRYFRALAHNLSCNIATK